MGNRKQTASAEDIGSIPPVNILLVDDLPDKLMVYKTVLEELGHKLVTAQSGEEALRLILKEEFAVILMDVNMPGMDGFETASFIRKRRKSSHTPIIFLTAFSDEMKIAQGYASGAVDYLFTPVVPDILKAKVRVFVELFQMRQQAALQAEERARRLAAEESDRCKDQFLGMLAHELRNPLAPIVNGMQLIQMIGPKDPKMEQIRQMVDRQVTHMVRLIDDLLDSTRLAQGKILLRKENCNLKEIIRQTLSDYQSIFDSKNIRMNLRMDEGEFIVDGDPTRLIQAIGNLFHNAHKFANEGGKVSIFLNRVSNAYAKIIVEDNGIGIEPDILPYIFDVFRQAEQGLDRNRGGLGLGLSLVRGLIDLHGGTVIAHSDGPDRGARFTITLPLFGESTAVEIPAPSSTTSQEINEFRHRILLVEDNVDAAESLSILLQYEGHEVRTVHTGPDGLKEAETFKPLIVLCDIGLPGMDGYQFMRHVRQVPGLESVCAIAMSGYGRAQDIRRAYEAGFNLHLTKPLDYNRLCRVLSNYDEVRNGVDIDKVP